MSCHIYNFAEITESFDENLDTRVVFESDGETLLFETFSPAGQDCVIEVTVGDDTTVQDVVSKIENDYDCFDVSEETMLWVDSEGHGTNGAPYDLEDILEDMKWYKDWIKRCAEHLKSFVD